MNMYKTDFKFLHMYIMHHTHNLPWYVTCLLLLQIYILIYMLNTERNKTLEVTEDNRVFVRNEDEVQGLTARGIRVLSAVIESFHIATRMVFTHLKTCLKTYEILTFNEREIIAHNLTCCIRSFIKQYLSFVYEVFSDPFHPTLHYRKTNTK